MAKDRPLNSVKSRGHVPDSGSIAPSALSGMLPGKVRGSRGPVAFTALLLVATFLNGTLFR